MSGWIISRVTAVLAACVLAIWLMPAARAEADTPLQTCFRPAASGERAAAVFADPRGFICGKEQRDAGSGDFWVMSRPLPALGPGALVRSGSVWQDGVTLYVRYADGTIRARGFTSADAWRQLKVGAFFELPIPAADVPATRLLWHVRGAANIRGIVLNPHVLTAAESKRLEVRLVAFYAAFAGLCVALLGFNAALGAALRQRFHPPYCAMVVFLMAYAGSATGLLGQLTGMDNNLRLRLNVLLLALTLSSALIFARRFFAPQVVGGWMRPAMGAAITVLIVVAGAYALLMPWRALLLDRLLSLAFLAALALAVPLLWRGWRTDDRYARAFAMAWAVPLLLASGRVGHALNVLAWNFWIDNSTLIAMAMEASFSALAIAWRIKALGEERDAAREQEMLARLLADSDPLTGLMNRRSFLREAIGRGEPHLLVLVDIDHFKQVNDTLGHDGGDQVLRVFADALRDAVPTGALVARIGGEEFAILAPADALELPDAILARIRAAHMPYDLTVTASLGTSCGTILDEPEWKRLYRRADEALYAAKHAGRDRARWAAAA
ncbi:MAG: diguanylate cyclase [Sphingomonas taxi]|uniref:diguanylate cyclase n=1 Tax=Sphingomonas taxi TaxID=1549858 RepID=A0A2W5P7M2_9SPHN|nr:MAG: diguanylate cyclase [Sphingomonas taxi]